MKKIYFDHAATTFPKPDEVSEAIYHYIKEQGCNINRGCYNQAYQVEEWSASCFMGKTAKM